MKSITIVLVTMMCSIITACNSTPKENEDQGNNMPDVYKYKPVLSEVDTTVAQGDFEAKINDLFTNTLLGPKNQATRALYPEQLDSMLMGIRNKRISRWRGRIISISFTPDRRISAEILCMGDVRNRTEVRNEICLKLIIGDTYFSENFAAKNAIVSDLQYHGAIRYNKTNGKNIKKSSRQLIAKGDKKYDYILNITEGVLVEVSGTINDVSDKLYSVNDNINVAYPRTHQDIDFLFTLDEIKVVE